MNTMGLVASKVRSVVGRLGRNEEGQDLIEYALLAGFISLVAILAITALGGGINTVFQNLADTVANIGG
jgi:pilus assembly protein Flp/PilA